MKNKKTWLIGAIVLVAVVGGALYFGNAQLQKGAFQFPFPQLSKPVTVVKKFFTFDLVVSKVMQFEVYFSQSTKMRIEILDENNNFVALMCEPAGSYPSMACGWTGVLTDKKGTIVKDVNGNNKIAPAGKYKAKILWGDSYQFNSYSEEFFAVTPGSV